MSAAPSTERIKQMLAERIGLDPASVGENLIANGIRSRMEALGAAGREEYEIVLFGPGEEIQALVEEIVIPESWFFRDTLPFDVLRDQARSGWVADRSRSPLQALSLPCAGGEEPYSIAITLAEAGLGPDRFRVDGVDVSARSMSRAVAGVYGSNSFRGPAATLRPKFFREHEGRYSIDPEIRRSVRFRVGNLLDPGLFQGSPPFDVVFCRNLLIYFDPPSRARAFASLARLTAENGLLFLGHADRGDDTPGSPFRSLGIKGSFGYRKGPVEAPKPPGPAPRSARPTGRPPSPGPRPDPKPMTSPSATPGPPPASIETVAGLLARASALADLGRYDEARTSVEQAIARGGPGARASSLLGLIRQAEGDLKGAESDFLRAVYLDPNDDEALLSLALLAGRRGDPAAEANYRQRAGRVISRKAGR